MSKPPTTQRDDKEAPGTIWTWDRIRPLHKEEYEYWQRHPLPLGWSVIQAPILADKPAAQS